MKCSVNEPPPYVGPPISTHCRFHISRNGRILYSVIPSDSAGAAVHRYYLMKELQYSVGLVVVVGPETYNKACFSIDEAMNDDLPADQTL